MFPFLNHELLPFWIILDAKIWMMVLLQISTIFGIKWHFLTHPISHDSEFSRFHETYYEFLEVLRVPKRYVTLVVNFLNPISCSGSPCLSTSPHYTSKLSLKETILQGYIPKSGVVEGLFFQESTLSKTVNTWSTSPKYSSKLSLKETILQDYIPKLGVVQG